MYRWGEDLKNKVLTVIKKDFFLLNKVMIFSLRKILNFLLIIEINTMMDMRIAESIR